MKPKIKLLFTAFLCVASSTLFAQSVNISTAKAIAENHLATISQPSLKSTASKGKNFHFTSIKASIVNRDTLYYILNDTINKGFVIVSADKRVRPVLAYSTDVSFNEKKQPEAFTAWMENRKKEIEYIKQNNLQADSTTKALWQNLSLKSAAIETTSVEPLIQTQWDQGCYYNSMCPADATGPCGHAFTGCTITAMAQIMKYWNYPTKGTGSHSYSHPTYGNLSADFGSTTYQWNQMPNNVTSQSDAVATLMYHCGISLNADYSPVATSALDPRDALVQYFNYSSNAMLVNRSGFTTSEWINLLKSELDLRHPIWYTGSSSFGHSFICDGYQDADYFHFNWGWSGSCDGYFYIENLNPSLYSFNEYQYALINIVPGDLPDGYNGYFLSANSVVLDSKGGAASVDVCSSTNWSASSDQSWLSLSINTGVSGKTTLTLTSTENNTGSDRSGVVKISVAGSNNQTITVNQLTKLNVTPGGLKNLISKNATATTLLTLHGTIDARDFKTMRDAMPALTDIDLSDVTVVAYSGTEGTNDGSTISFYQANVIPPKAFCVPFQGQNFLKSITLPPTITSIESFAFKDSKYLTAINIPASVTDIPVLAFYLCNALINVDLENPYYSSIDGVLFNKNQTTILQCPISKTGNYTIPSSVNSIGDNAFNSCTKLTTVTIPSSVNFIGQYAFFDCKNLSSIFIPASVSTIESEAFRDCPTLINVDQENPNYSSNDGVLFNKTQTKLIQCPTSKTGNYSIPTSVNSIGRFAFSSCSGLTNISIPSTVKTIEICAFNACGGITNITIPSSVTSIEYGTFNFCTRLSCVYIPASVNSIKDCAFSDCSKLDSIYIYILSPVNLNSSINVFNLVNKGTCTLYVPYGSKAVYQAANHWKDFKNIVEMPGIFLSDNNLGMGPLAGTTQITLSSSLNWTATSDQTWLTVNPSGALLGSNTIVFSASTNPTASARKAKVTISATGTASQTIEVTQYGKIEVTPGNLKAVLANQLSTIKSITLAGMIDARDFKTMRDEMPELNDIDLNDVTIASYTGPDGTDGTNYVIYPADGVPNFAFYNPNMPQNKAGLSSIILPSSVISIGDCAFKNREGLATINIPASVSSIGKKAFINFQGFINVDVNNNKYSSSEGILFNKTQTELIQCPTSKNGSCRIPDTVTSIGEYAFMNCIGLSDVLISSSVNSIGEGAFFHCVGLTSIDGLSSVSTIGIYAFSECSKLISVPIPSSIISIGSCTFFSCSGLRSIYIYRKSPLGLNNSFNVFTDVNKIGCALYVPFGSKKSYAAATQWKDFLNIIEMPGLIVSATNSKVTSEANSTVSVNLKSNVEWTAVSDQSWLNIDHSSGSGDQTLTFTAQENTSPIQRTAIVTVSSSNLNPQIITIFQEAKNTTGIDPQSINAEFMVYPNPTTGKIKLVFDQIQLGGIEVTINDITGKTILEQIIQEKEVWLDLSGSVSGIYFIKADQKNFKTQKIILE
jgi:hypothetical protein